MADVEECAELIRLRKAVRVRSPVLAEDLRSRPSLRLAPSPKWLTGRVRGQLPPCN